MAVAKGKLEGTDREWEQLARTDPMWSILSDPTKRAGRWDEQEFFASGESEIAEVLNCLESIGLHPDRSAMALDFGCGVGRLTQALAKNFQSCCGVDVSPTMIELANQLNQHPQSCRYAVNEDDRLHAFADDSFGFVYSSIVLQHIPPRSAERYLQEFIRILAPSGILVFQLPDQYKIGSGPLARLNDFLERAQTRLALRTRLRALWKAAKTRERVTVARSEMNCIPESRLYAVLEDAGGTVVDVRITNHTEPDFNGDIRYLREEPSSGFVSKQYCVVKRG